MYRWCCTYSHNYPCPSCFLWGTAQNAQGSIQFRYERVYVHMYIGCVNCSVLVYQVVTVEVFLVFSHSTSCSEHHHHFPYQLCPPFLSCFPPPSFSLPFLFLSSPLFFLSLSSLFVSPSLSLLHAGLLKLGLRTTFFHIADQLQRFVEVTDI